MTERAETRETDDNDTWHMLRALELAARGQGTGRAKPYGRLRDRQGWPGRRRRLAPAIRRAARRSRRLLATCRPARCVAARCTSRSSPAAITARRRPAPTAIIRAGVRRVVAAMSDPFPAVAGGGVAALRKTGIETQVGLLEHDARQLAAPYLKLLTTKKPWVIAKWAMTLDGKIATHTGNSRWISSPASRGIVHALRGRVDAILVGSGTAMADDPLLTARPESPATISRVAMRIVVDSQASLAMDSQLVRTARQTPVMVAVSESAELAKREQLAAAGCEVFVCAGHDHRTRLESLLAELGRRRMTNVLVEGGSRLMGSLLDAGQIDEVTPSLRPN